MTTTHVGARMEPVVPKRSLYGPDYLRIAVVAVVSVGIHLWLITHTAVTARDGVGFARFALDIQQPDLAVAPHEPPLPDEVPDPNNPPEEPTQTGIDVIARSKQHPGYPVAVWAVAKFVRHAWTDEPQPEAYRVASQYLLAAQIASGLAGVLLVIPTYLTGRMLFGRGAGFAAALMFQILPVPARTTSDAMTEGVYLLAVASAVMLGVRAVRRPGVGGFLACGLVSGAAYLVRPEGLSVPIAVGLVASWLGLTRLWPRDLTLGRLAALAVGVVLVGGPYVALIGKLTNKPTGKELIPSTGDVKGLFSVGTNEPPGPIGGPVFASYWVFLPEDKAGLVKKVRAAVVNAVKETGKSMFYFPAGLAVLGVFLLRRRIAAEPGVCVLLALAGVYFCVLIRLGTGGISVNSIKTYYIGEHHTLVLVWIGCLFAAAALKPLAAALVSVPGLGQLFAGRVGPILLLAGVTVAALPESLKPLHANREGFKHAGLWLASTLHEHAEKQEPVVVMDSFEWTQWYAGWALYHIPTDSKRARIRYVVLDNKDKDHVEHHTRLPRLDAALEVSKAGVPVYHWPEDVPVEMAQVRIYKTVGPSEWDKSELKKNGK